MIKNHKIYETNREGVIWEITPDLAEKLKLNENQQVVLKCGSLSARTKVVTSHSPNLAGEHMGLSKDALNKLKIHEGLSLGLKPIDTGQFRLGPVIGILTFPHVIAKRQLRIYAAYAKRMADIGMLYVFGPEDIHPQSNTITGYHYNAATGNWQTGVFPYPDAVMDRMYPNNKKAHVKLEKVIGKKKIFNKKTRINKLEFYTALNKDLFLRNYIPETRLFFHIWDLKYFLSKHSEIFLKPLDSMKGNGIVCVTDEDSTLLCRYMNGNDPVSEQIVRADSIFKILERTGGRKRPYIIQAAVNRMKCRERLFNFRVMVTKNGSGQWTVPAIFAKLAVPGAFLTNRSLGADYISLKDLFEGIKTRLPYTKKDFLDLLTDMSLKTAAVLDNDFGPLGKLGIDIVIDTSGKPWLIEANGNPGRMRPKEHNEFPDWNSQIYDHPIAYALYLAGFSKL